MKYTAKIITTEVVYLNQDGQIVTGLSSNDKLLSAIYGTYIFAELAQCVGQITGKTLSALNAAAYDYAEANNLGYDFKLFIVK